MKAEAGAAVGKSGSEGTAHFSRPQPPTANNPASLVASRRETQGTRFLAQETVRSMLFWPQAFALPSPRPVLLHRNSTL